MAELIMQFTMVHVYSMTCNNPVVTLVAFKNTDKEIKSNSRTVHITEVMQFSDLINADLN